MNKGIEGQAFMDKKEEIMKSLKISSSQKTYYYYKNYRYENLGDAINYAELETARTEYKG